LEIKSKNKAQHENTTNNSGIKELQRGKTLQMGIRSSDTLMLFYVTEQNL
jgi:hypothetical protein